jgi:hypothetical protein
MPVCPKCEYEYVEGITICPDCGEILVDKEHLKKPEELSEKDWEVVFTSGKEYVVDMIKDNLESAGIDAIILSQKDRNFPTIGDFSVIKLLVKRSDFQEAMHFIMQLKDKEEDEEKD